MKTLLHICCAPCSVACVDDLRQAGIDFDGYWYNPNIHPFTEYNARRQALCDFARSAEFRLLLDDEYGLRDFARATYPSFGSRCGYCYDIRLKKTAQYAHDNGYDSFSTTLLISPYQDHELIIKTAQKYSSEFGVDFLYRDFRPLFRAGQSKAREMGLYMQKYCGCVFSEEERYQKKIDKLTGFRIQEIETK